MDGELEYLIRAWKQVWKSLQNAEAVGAVTVEDAETSVQGNCRTKHWELGMRTQCELCRRWKGTNLERKMARFAGRESPQTVGATSVGASLWMWVYAVQLGNCNSITNFCFTLEKVGVLEYSRSVTQKVNL